MKRKYLIILIIIVLISLLLLGYFIIKQLDGAGGHLDIIVRTDTIIDFIKENESKDENLKTFVAAKEISTIYNKENVEYYVLALIDTYNIENQSLRHNQSVFKIYKFILKDTKIISSDNLNIEDIDSYNDYTVFPEDIIKKYLPLKDSVNLTKAIEKQIDNFYNGNNKSNNFNETNNINELLVEDYQFIGEPANRNILSYQIDL